jgi:DNA-binding helix-hairpin-helix protein with protein kinase domain
MTEYIDDTGQLLILGKKLGSGGEGAVYELPSLNAAVKIYHQPLSAEKQQKLRALVKSATPALLKVAAWPIALVYKKQGYIKNETNDVGQDAQLGEMCGLIMPKLGAYEPLHHLYSPAQRKQKFPDKSWSFLLHVARNIASVFDVIHAHGHVIGDVNPNLVYVDGKGLIRLIDCDSFQITYQQQVYPCDVGVPHFMAPELQQQPSFRGLLRHANQDCFGLAILIFHLLLMGRHPYAGVRDDRSDRSLEQSIAEHAYAFADDAAQRGLRPPPNSVLPSILPPTLRQLFAQAFAANSVAVDAAFDTRPSVPLIVRPSPAQWVEALSASQSTLQSCRLERLHTYWRGLTACPWCEHQDRSGVYFFLSLVDDATDGDFDLAVVWEQIMAVNDPPAPAINDLGNVLSLPVKQNRSAVAYRITQIGILLVLSGALLYWPWQIELLTLLIAALFLPAARPLSHNTLLGWPSLPKPVHRLLWAYRISKVGLAVILLGAYCYWPWRVELLVLWVRCLFLPNLDLSTFDQDRQKIAQQAQHELQQWQERLQRLSQQHAFFMLRKRLLAVRAEYESLAEAFLRALQGLKEQLRERQLQKFLDGFFVSNTTIPSIGVTRRAMLLSFGIETAADVELERMLYIPSFSPKVCNELLDWRQRLHAWFVFDAKQGVDPQDVMRLKHQFAVKRTQLQSELRVGVGQLKVLRGDLQQQYQQLQPVLTAASERIRQLLVK